MRSSLGDRHPLSSVFRKFDLRLFKVSTSEATEVIFLADIFQLMSAGKRQKTNISRSYNSGPDFLSIFSTTDVDEGVDPEKNFQ